MKKKIHHLKRHYKKIAAAIGSAAILATSIVPSIAVVAASPNQNTQVPPAATQTTQQQQNDQSTPNLPTEEAGAKQVLDIKATAYAPGPHDNDQWGDKTYMGTKVRPGVIAVDPRIIPLGSHVMIKYPDGTKEYAVAEDTGGAIKGHRIDIAKRTVSEAYKFGIKPVKVYVLNTPEQQHQA